MLLFLHIIIRHLTLYMRAELVHRVNTTHICELVIHIFTPDVYVTITVQPLHNESQVCADQHNM